MQRLNSADAWGWWGIGWQRHWMRGAVGKGDLLDLTAKVGGRGKRTREADSPCTSVYKQKKNKSRQDQTWVLVPPSRSLLWPHSQDKVSSHITTRVCELITMEGLSINLTIALKKADIPFP